MEQLINTAETMTKLKTYPNFVLALSQMLEEVAKMPEEEKKAWDEHVKALDEQAMKESRLNAFRNCGIGEKYFNSDFDKFVIVDETTQKLIKVAKQFCQDVIDGKQRHLILFGNCGTGKTSISAACLKYIMLKTKKIAYGLPVHFTGCYTTMVDLIQELEIINYKKSTEYKIECVSSSDVCVFDEIGRSASKKISEKDLIFQLIDSVYCHNGSSILITNLNSSEFKNFVGNAVISRLKENGAMMFADTTNGQDFRVGNTKKVLVEN